MLSRSWARLRSWLGGRLPRWGNVIGSGDTAGANRRRVLLVTDSTACLSEPLAAELGITVVPLQLRIGDRATNETTASGGAVAEALRSRVPVSTSQPAPRAFYQAYQDARLAGAQAVVSVHLSRELSGTCDSARTAAAESGVDVRVIDSGMLAMGLGYAVIAAAEVARAGGTVEEVVAAVEARRASTSILVYVDTLEYLRRGGRIGAARALLGSALAIKPLLQVVEGRIEPLEKVRTASRAIARLEEIAVERAGDQRVDLAVHHLGAPERAITLSRRLRARIPAVNACHVTEVGAVIGAHVGPGMLAVVISPCGERAAQS